MTSPPWFVVLPIVIAALLIAYTSSAADLRSVNDAWRYRISYALICALGAAWIVSQLWALLSRM